MQAIKDIYLFSGLGADERAFSRLNLSGYRTHAVPWQEPQRGDTLATYAQRLSADVRAANPVLLGLSFGGMVAIEIAKQIRPVATILISSAKQYTELPGAFRAVGKTGLLKLIPPLWLTQPNGFVHWLMGATSAEDKKLLATMIRASDPHFMKWALQQIAYWDSVYIPPSVYHIHGTHDRVLPVRHIASFLPVKGGSHFMVANCHETVSRHIRKILDTHARCVY